MKKIIFCLELIILYLVSYGLFLREQKDLINYESPLLMNYYLKLIFYVFVGISVCIFAGNLRRSKDNVFLKILSTIVVLIPVLLWLGIPHASQYWTDYGLILEFIFLGAYIYSILENMYEKINGLKEGSIKKLKIYIKVDKYGNAIPQYELKRKMTASKKKDYSTGQTKIQTKKAQY